MTDTLTKNITETPDATFSSEIQKPEEDLAGPVGSSASLLWPHYERLRAARNCIAMDDFLGASTQTKRAAMKAARQLSEAIMAVKPHVTETFAVFFEEDDGIVEIIADFGPRRLSLEWSASLCKYRLIQVEVGKVTQSPWRPQPYDLSGDVKWLLNSA